MTKESSNSRLKLALVFVFISLILLFISVWQIRPVIVDVGDILGLASHLPVTYWIGFSILVFCSILAYLHRESQRKILYAVILLVIVLYTVGLPSFVDPNPAYSNTYRTITGSEEILNTGHVDVHSSLPTISYRQWPGFNILSSEILLITGAHTFTFLRYFPIFIALFLILVILSIGKRLSFSPQQCFLFASVFILSQWHSYMLYPAPQPLATALYLVLFMLALRLQGTARENLIFIILFAVLLFTHGMTPLVLLAPLAIQSIYYRRNGRLLAILGSMFAAWYLFIQPDLFAVGTSYYYSETTTLDVFSRLFHSTKYAALTEQREIINNIRLSYFVLYLFYGIAALVAYFGGRARQPKNQRGMIGILLCWMIGPALLSFGFSTELTERLYFLLLVPALALIIFSLPKKSLLPLMIIPAILVIPAHYGTSSSEVPPDTELSGARFYASEIDAYYPYYYGGGGVNYLLYYNEDYFEFSSLVGFGLWAEPDTSRLGRADYIIDSLQSRNFNIHYYGSDLVEGFLSEQNSDIVYSNGQFFIHRPEKSSSEG